MKKLARLCSLLLAAALLAGAVPALAANGTATTGGLLGDSFSADGAPIYGTYSAVTSTQSIQTFDWPDSGYVFLIVTSSYPISRLNGVTIPPNIVLDAYQYRSGGTYTFITRYDTTDGKSFTVTNAGNNGNTTVAGFSDVRSTDYYADAVAWAKEAGVTAGTNADGTVFSPKATVTRAEAMTFLWRAAGKPEPKSTESPFTDVTDPSAYYYKAVLWAAEQGITNGTGGTDFGLNGTLAYDQILTFLCRAAGENADGSDWSAVAVNWAAQNGLTDGLSFSPKADCPRADVVYCLWKRMAGGSAEDPAAQQRDQSGQPDPEGARAAIIKGLLQHETLIDLNAYHMDFSDMEKLAAEIVVTGEHAMFVKTYHVNQNPVLQNASTLSVEYGDRDLEQVEQILERVKAVSESVITPGMSEYEIAKELHDYLALNCAYDAYWEYNNAPAIVTNAHTAYGALIEGAAVCEGYALAYMAMLRYNGIECIYVSGGTHGWNIVKIDGEWYHVDVTWDDPVPDKAGYVRYNYFLKSDAVFRKDHPAWDQGKLYALQGDSQWTPEYVCTSTKYDNITPPSTTEQAK